jgi:hypothetical protein
VDSRELLMAEAYDEGMVSEVIRPAAIIPEESARAVLVELALRDVANGGVWASEPSLWSRYDRPWTGVGSPGDAELIGAIQMAFGTPTRYDLTIYRVTLTRVGVAAGWTVSSLCDEALGYAGLGLAGCPRATLGAPPKPFRFSPSDAAARPGSAREDGARLQVDGDRADRAAHVDRGDAGRDVQPAGQRHQLEDPQHGTLVSDEVQRATEQ